MKELSAEDQLKVVKSQFEEFSNNTQTMRELAMKCRDYKDGYQLTDAELKILKQRKQPAVIDNKIQDKVDTLLGLEKQQRTDPKAFPREPGDTGAAEAATDALRYIADASDYQRSARKPAAENLIVEGLCYGQVIVEKANPPKVRIEHIRWDRGYYDIRSLQSDFSDKEWCGYFTWMDEPVVRRMWKGSEDVIEASFANESPTGNREQDDKPRYVMSDQGRKRVQVFTHYHKVDDVWHESKWCKGGFLEAPKPAAYKGEDGKPGCCMEIQALYRDSEGNPYGSVQRYLDLQDEHNKRRSKMLHLLNSKRLIAQKGAFLDINKARAELHKPDGVLEANTDIAQVRVEDNLDAADGQWRLLQQTDIALSQTGPNEAISGLSGDISGRAKELDQASGALSLMPLFDALESWEVRIYRQVWCRVQQFWTAPMWIRVTDDEKKPKYVGLNQPVTHAEDIAEQLKNQQLPDEQKATMVQQLASDPQAQEHVIANGQVKKRNQVAQMDLDIIISRSKDTVNIQQEQFEILASLADKRPEVPFVAILEMSQLDSRAKQLVKDGIAEAGNGQQALAQAQQQMQAVQDAAKELDAKQAAIDSESEQLTAQQAELDKSKLEIEKLIAQLDIKAQKVDVKNAMFDADVAKAMASLDIKESKVAMKDQLVSGKEQINSQKEAVSKDVVSDVQTMVQKFIDDATGVIGQIHEAAKKPQPKPRIKEINREGGKLIPVYEETLQ